MTALEPQPGIQGPDGVSRGEGREALAERVQQYDVRPPPITQWRAKLLEGAADERGAEQVLRRNRRWLLQLHV